MGVGMFPPIAHMIHPSRDDEQEYMEVEIDTRGKEISKKSNKYVLLIIKSIAISLSMLMAYILATTLLS